MFQHFIVRQDQTLLDFLSSLFLLQQKEKIYTPYTPIELLNWGAIYLNGKRITDPDHSLSPNNLLRIHFLPRRFPFHLLKTDQLFFEHPDYIVVYKPSGIPTHPTLDNLKENLVHFWRQHYESLFVTHRLDGETQGLIVLARNKQFLVHFNHLLSTRAVEKKYWAFTHINLEKLGLITHFMKPSIKAPREVFDLAEEGFSKCDLKIESIQMVGPYFCYELELLTGRTHQIRAQFKKLGSAIVGDVLYGEKESPFFGLAAYQISFENQTYSLSKDYYVPMITGVPINS